MFGRLAREKRGGGEWLRVRMVCLCEWKPQGASSDNTCYIF